MSEYIVEPLIVDKVFGKWILSRKFVNESYIHSQLSKDKQVLLQLKCVSEMEFTLSIDISMNVVKHLDVILQALFEQMSFSKMDMLETTRLFLPKMRRFIFVSLHPFICHHVMKRVPKAIEGAHILNLSDKRNGVCFHAIFPYAQF